MICERCGRSSKDTKICSYCNTPDVGDNGESASVHDSGEWGWAEISIAAVPSSDRFRVVAAIHKGWEELERFTVLQLLNSQASALEFKSLAAKLLVRRDLLTSLVDKAKREAESISFTFTPTDTIVETAEQANLIISLAKLRAPKKTPRARRIVEDSTLVWRDDATQPSEELLGALNLDELKGLENEIAREIASRELAEISKARAQILSIAKRVGVPIGELIDNTQKKQKTGKTSVVQVKYPSHAHSKET